MKRVRWVGSSKADILSFPADAQDDVGYQLYRVQAGLDPTDWKPMSSVGTGVCEIRTHYRGEYRLIYVARVEEAVYVLHTFQKKTQKTPQRDIEIARRRFASIRR